MSVFDISSGKQVAVADNEMLDETGNAIKTKCIVTLVAYAFPKQMLTEMMQCTLQQVPCGARREPVCTVG